mmetsp:Transcript_14686/g.21719  ORF Transcript_14686/g.21719 Transcript_14686/m.21719 type:complete len:110 (-) Transcript_14686:855-1184(-)
MVRVLKPFLNIFVLMLLFNLKKFLPTHFGKKLERKRFIVVLLSVYINPLLIQKKGKQNRKNECDETHGRNEVFYPILIFGTFICLIPCINSAFKTMGKAIVWHCSDGYN